MHIKITQAPLGQPKNRWIENITNEEHHTLRCISSSHLKFISDGCSMSSYYKRFILKETAYKSSKVFTTGTIAHLAVLEPERFEKSIVVSDIDQRTKEFKDLRLSLAAKIDDTEAKQLEKTIDELNEELKIADTKEQTKVIKDKLKKFKTQLQEKKLKDSDEVKIKFTKDGGFINSDNQETFIVKTEEMNMYKAFQKKFDEHERLSVWVPACIIEETGVAQDPETELWMSLRGDARCPRGFFLDPKTIDEPLSTKAIQNYMAKYGLHIQAAHYLETANLIEEDTYKHFFFVFMSKTDPYDIALVKMDEASIEQGKLERRVLLNKIAECEGKGKWPEFDYNDGKHAITLGLPAWGFR